MNCTAHKMMHIDSLPLETFVEILKRMDGASLGRCRRVSRRWRAVVDDAELLWRGVCAREYRGASRLARRKAGRDCTWYHLYRNLTRWENIATAEKNLKEFYKFNLHDKCHALELNYGVLPLRDTRGIVMYDMDNLKYIPVAVGERNCTKIANNDIATVLLLKSGMLLQRSVENSEHMSEAFFKADDFVLTDEDLYFYNSRDIYKCNLMLDTLSSKLILHCGYDIKEFVYSDGMLHIFTDCGKIVSVTSNSIVSVRPISCPAEWIRQIRHINAIDDKNFVCYSRSLFKIETDKYQHLYLDFPPVTALFFYGEVVLIGTKTGEILLYRLSSQKKATKPIFESLAALPSGKFAVQLDVCEQLTGPVVVVATFFEIYLLDVKFFPHDDQSKTTKQSFPPSKMHLYKRLLRLRDRLQMY